MAEIAALQRTVRRCTAVIVVALGILVGAVSPGNVPVAAVLVVGGIFYLVGSFVYVPETDVDADEVAADGE
jgi:predicted membrane channel-forming protein YqfA (hemolysin III family)